MVNTLNHYTVKENPTNVSKDLISYCVREKVPYTVFEDWSTILSTCKSIVAGQTNVKEVAAAGA